MGISDWSEAHGGIEIGIPLNLESPVFLLPNPRVPPKIPQLGGEPSGCRRPPPARAWRDAVPVAVPPRDVTHPQPSSSAQFRSAPISQIACNQSWTTLTPELNHPPLLISLLQKLQVKLDCLLGTTPARERKMGTSRAGDGQIGWRRRRLGRPPLDFPRW